WQATQTHLRLHNPGEALDTIGEWRVLYDFHAVRLVFLLERHRHRDDAAIEFRDYHVHRGVQWIQPARGRLPLTQLHTTDDGLKNRNIEIRHCVDRPTRERRTLCVDVPDRE